MNILKDAVFVFTKMLYWSSPKDIVEPETIWRIKLYSVYEAYCDTLKSMRCFLLCFVFLLICIFIYPRRVNITELRSRCFYF